MMRNVAEKCQVVKKQVLMIISLFVSVVILICALIPSSIMADDNHSKESLKKVIKVGILQQLEHPSLDQVRENFINDLKKAIEEKGSSLELDIQNAQNDVSNCQTIASQFANKDLDLVMTLGTAASQAAAKEIKNVPIIASAVTDPLASRLVKSLEEPGSNVTAVSDLSSAEEQVKLLLAWKTDAKKVGIVYSSNEANSIQQAELIRKELEKNGLESSDYTFSNSSELNSLLETAMQAADAIYIPTDNTVASSMPLVHKLELEYKTAVIVAAQGMLEEGGLSCVGIDYRKLGSKTAETAIEILIDGKDAGKIPVKYLDELDVMYREDTMEALGLKLPDELKSRAEAVEKSTAK